MKVADTMERRDRTKVYVNETGTITIEQGQQCEDPACVTVHPDYVEQLIMFLEDARDEALATKQM